LIWLGGIILMVALYVVGPERFIAVFEDYISRLWWFLDDVIDALARRAYEVVHAAAIALYAVFVALALTARWRGQRSGGALFVVTLLFLLLVGTRWYDPGTSWFVAAVLAGVGAVVMTNRLVRPPAIPRGPHDPWRPRGRSDPASF
jgi:hypothetical protein